MKEIEAPSHSERSSPLDDAMPDGVLIVDDDPVSLRLAASMLEDIRVTFALAGRVALEMAAANPPALIVLDHHLPDLSGVEVCRRLKADPATADTPVIFLTRDTDPLLEARGFAAGASDFVTKPFTAEALRARVGVHLALRQKIHELTRIANFDDVTRLPNRRAFLADLKRETGIARRENRRLSLAMLDIDQFKAINDSLGHEAGDTYLRDVASIVDGALKRPADSVARFAGDEFVLLLPETGLSAAVDVAERVRADIESHFARRSATSDEQDYPVALTVSIGCATFQPLAAGGTTAFIRAADDALYAAKEAGKNRVHPDRSSAE